MLPIVKLSRDFVVLSLDGSREVDDNLEEDKPVTLETQLDQYCNRPDTGDFNQITLLKFVKKYKIPKKKGNAIILRKKEVLVIPRLFIAHQILIDQITSNTVSNSLCCTSLFVNLNNCKLKKTIMLVLMPLFLNQEKIQLHLVMISSRKMFPQ